MNIAQKLANFVFPSLRSNGNSSHAHRTHLPPNEANNNSETPSRCQFTFSDGRQCRLPAKVSAPPRKGYQQDALLAGNEVELSPVEEVGNQSASFCVQHASKQKRSPGAEGAPDAVLEAQGLVALCGDLTTATNINRALSQVFLLTAQGRISQKQAVAFGYLSQLLLQTVPGIRSEFVSAHGYQAWQTHLKSHLKAKIAPLLPTPAPLPESPASPPQPASAPATMPVAHKEIPRPAATAPDYNSIYRRSLDLLDRKFDTTPEGRREATALMHDLDLINAAVAKPRKPHKEVQRSRRDQGSSSTSPRNERDVDFVAPPSRRPPESCSPGRGATGVPESRRPGASATPEKKTAPWGGEPALGPLPSVQSQLAAAKPNAAGNFVAPPSSQPESPSPGPRQQPEPPTPPNRTAHTTDWYAPASWSGPQPDPYPSRSEQLKRKLGTMSDRRAQHQNQSRAFWR